MAKEREISYEVASKVLPVVVAGENSRKSEALYETLQAREFGKMLKRGEFLEAYEFLERKKFLAEGVGQRIFEKCNISESYMTKKKKNKLILKGISAGLQDPIEALNCVLRSFGHKENYYGKEIAFSDLFNYGFSEGVDLKKHDCGKCILSYEDAGFYFAVSKDKSDMIPVDLNLENITRVMNNDFMSNKVGLHRNITGNPSLLLGGASYFMLKKDNIFIFDKSQDFGKISMPILHKCFEGSGIKVVDNFGKSSVSLEDEVLRHFRKKDIRVEPVFDDDIPF